MLFLDEPTTGLDPRSRNEMWDMVRRLVADGTTVLLTTQYLEEADQLATTSRSSTTGRSSRRGTPDELKASTGRQTLAVRPVNPGRLSTVINVVGTLARTEPEVRNTTVTALVTDPDVVPAIVRRLDESGITLAELALRGSTLDEVFLSLTGHRSEAQEALV